MGHQFRFFGKRISASHWHLVGDECEHARKVLRLKVGDDVELLDGGGIIGCGTIAEVSKEKIVVNTSYEKMHAVPQVEVVMFLSALKNADMDDLIPDLSEIGLSKLYVFRGEKAEKSRLSDKSVERWQRIARNSAKQSKRAYPLILITLRDIDTLMMEMQRFDEVYVCDPDAKESLVRQKTSSRAVALLIGNEMGLDASLFERMKLSKINTKSVRLGPHVLRAITCARVAGAIASIKAADLH